VKLAIVGGGGVRVPLLVNGLVSRGLAFDEIALFDIDAARLGLMAELARARLTAAVRVTTHEDAAASVQGADFVVTSIRVGGLAAREHDEATSLAHGIVGQETVGPAGFAMAVRTIPVITHYARVIAEHAPNAWVINFTNPVGIITQAMRRAANLEIIGICDTPTELFAETAHALHVDPLECTFDYVGLNHLGWLREVHHGGRPLLRDVWQDEETLSRIYMRPLFPTAYLSDLRLLPTEYVYFYAFPDRAVANTRAAGRTRGMQVAALTARLFAELAARPQDRIRLYEDYLAERSGSYMQAETGQQVPAPSPPWAELTGYDRIAYDVISAIVNDTNAIVPLDVANDGNIPELEPDDVIEPPCMVGGSGPIPLRVGSLPQAVRDLVVRVKAYERATIDAAFSGSREALVGALAFNPLVSSRAVASTLIDHLMLS
jgi:6-phospho-beta-glucosidase